jgi:amino-acid N-acetyltransferase
MYEDGQAENAEVAVDSNYSNLGVGPKMVHYLIEKAKSLHAKSVFVLTTQSADWFETLGFTAAPIDTLPKKRREKWSEKRGSKLLKINL